MQTVQINFDLDKEGLSQRGSCSEFLLDKDIVLMARQNRMTLNLDHGSPHLIEGIDSLIKEIILRCIAHPHPDCTFDYVRLTVLLAKDSQAKVVDLSPKKVDSDQPLKITTMYKGGLSFEYKEITVADLASIEKAQEYQVYYPEIFGSGVNTNRVIWDFKTPASGIGVHVDRDLFLLINYPKNISSIKAQVKLRARVTRKGLIGYIPLIGQKTEEFYLKSSSV